jgi:hypothetical protein
VDFYFCLPAGGYQSTKIKIGTAVARSGWAASGVKCKWGCAAAKYALHSDAFLPAVAFRKAGNHSTNNQCVAHVLRRKDLQFYGMQPDQRTAGTPLYLNAAISGKAGLACGYWGGLSVGLELLSDLIKNFLCIQISRGTILSNYDFSILKLHPAVLYFKMFNTFIFKDHFCIISIQYKVVPKVSFLLNRFYVYRFHSIKLTQRMELLYFFL